MKDFVKKEHFFLREKIGFVFIGRFKGELEVVIPPCEAQHMASTCCAQMEAIGTRGILR